MARCTAMESVQRRLCRELALGILLLLAGSSGRRNGLSTFPDGQHNFCCCSVCDPVPSIREAQNDILQKLFSIYVDFLDDSRLVNQKLSLRTFIANPGAVTESVVVSSSLEGVCSVQQTTRFAPFLPVGRVSSSDKEFSLCTFCHCTLQLHPQNPLWYSLVKIHLSEDNIERLQMTKDILPHVLLPPLSDSVSSPSPVTLESAMGYCSNLHFEPSCSSNSIELVQKGPQHQRILQPEKRSAKPLAAAAHSSRQILASNNQPGRESVWKHVQDNGWLVQTGCTCLLSAVLILVMGPRSISIAHKVYKYLASCCYKTRVPITKNSRNESGSFSQTSLVTSVCSKPSRKFKLTKKTPTLPAKPHRKNGGITAPVSPSDRSHLCKVLSVTQGDCCHHEELQLSVTTQCKTPIELTDKDQNLDPIHQNSTPSSTSSLCDSDEGFSPIRRVGAAPPKLKSSMSTPPIQNSPSPTLTPNPTPRPRSEPQARSKPCRKQLTNFSMHLNTNSSAHKSNVQWCTNKNTLINRARSDLDVTNGFSMDHIQTHFQPEYNSKTDEVAFRPCDGPVPGAISEIGYSCNHQSSTSNPVSSVMVQLSQGRSPLGGSVFSFDVVETIRSSRQSPPHNLCTGGGRSNPDQSSAELHHSGDSLPAATVGLLAPTVIPNNDYPELFQTYSQPSRPLESNNWEEVRPSARESVCVATPTPSYRSLVDILQDPTWSNNGMNSVVVNRTSASDGGFSSSLDSIRFRHIQRNFWP